MGRKLVLLTLACLVLTVSVGTHRFYQRSGSDRPFVGAGILPYAVVKGEIFILLGYDPGRGWTSFGGAPEKVVSVTDANPRWETKVETALREASHKSHQKRSGLYSDLLLQKVMKWCIRRVKNMVQINQNYKIESDNLNVTLSKREVSKKSPGKERWRTVGYYSSFESVLKALVDMEIKGTGLKDLETVLSKIQELKKMIDGANLGKM